MKSTLFAILLTLFCFSQVYAQPPEVSRRPGPRMEHRGRQGPPAGNRELRLNDLDRLVKPLELQPDQVSVMRDLLFEAGRVEIRHQNEIRLLDFTIQARMMEEAPDRQELKKLHQERAEHQAAIGWSKLETQLELKTILTAEQQQKLRTRPRPTRPPGPPGREGPHRRAEMPEPSGPGGG